VKRGNYNFKELLSHWQLTFSSTTACYTVIFQLKKKSLTVVIDMQHQHVEICCLV